MNKLASAQSTNITVTGNQLAYAFPERGGAVTVTTGTAGILAVGYGRVDEVSSTTPTGVAILQDRQNGVLVSEAGVPGTFAVQSGRLYVEANGSLNTGVAFANPNSVDVVVSFFFTDQFGNDIARSSFVLQANRQVAMFVTEAPFLIRSPFAGTFTFATSAALPIGVIGLRTFVNERGEFLMTTQPVTPLPNLSSAGDILLAHFADGGGWRSQVILVNPTDLPIVGTVQFLSEGTAATPGVPLTLNVNGQVSATFNYSINPRSSVKLETSGFGQVAQVGSVHITPAAANPPFAYNVFTFSTGGVTVSQTTVQPVSGALAYRSFVEMNSGLPLPGTIENGIAIANNSSVSATVNFELSDLNGGAIAITSSVTVPAMGHIARTVPELFPTLVLSSLTAPLRGVLRISSSNFVSVANLRLRFNERGDVLTTTIPVSNETSSSTTNELLFPHVVDGVGFSTEFVLFSGILGQNGTGKIQLTGQNGQALTLTVR
jgi:hypothetical protein